MIIKHGMFLGVDSLQSMEPMTFGFYNFKNNLEISSLINCLTGKIRKLQRLGEIN